MTSNNRHSNSTRTFRIDAGINWQLDAKMLEAGIVDPQHLSEIARSAGLELDPESIDALYHGRVTARAADRSWHDDAMLVSQLLGCAPEDIYGFAHQWHPEDHAVAHEAPADDVDAYVGALGNDGMSAETREEVAELMSGLLTKVTAREERVVRMFYGIGTKAKKKEEIGRSYGVTSHRADEILKKAKRKLKKAVVKRGITTSRLAVI